MRTPVLRKDETGAERQGAATPPRRLGSATPQLAGKEFAVLKIFENKDGILDFL